MPRFTIGGYRIVAKIQPDASVRPHIVTYEGLPNSGLFAALSSGILNFGPIVRAHTEEATYGAAQRA